MSANSSNDSRDFYGRSALHRAVMDGDLIKVELLLVAGVVNVNETWTFIGHSGTLLHLCVYADQFEILRLLVDVGRAVIDAKDDLG